MAQVKDCDNEVVQRASGHACVCVKVEETYTHSLSCIKTVWQTHLTTELLVHACNHSFEVLN